MLSLHPQQLASTVSQAIALISSLRTQRPVLYPISYALLLLLAVLDILTTRFTLSAGGCELNTIAARVIEHLDVPGMVALKFVSISAVLIICEHVGRARFMLGKKLAGSCVMIASTPVVIGGGQIALNFEILRQAGMI